MGLRGGIIRLCSGENDVEEVRSPISTIRLRGLAAHTTHATHAISLD